MSCFEVLDVFFRAEDFSYNLGVLYEGLGISTGKLQFVIKKDKFQHFSILWSSKPWIHKTGSYIPTNAVDPEFS
jgi:hypothetical protein